MELDDLKKLTNEELLDIYNDNHGFISYLDGLLEQVEKEIDDDE